MAAVGGSGGFSSGEGLAEQWVRERARSSRVNRAADFELDLDDIGLFSLTFLW